MHTGGSIGSHVHVQRAHSARHTIGAPHGIQYILYLLLTEFTPYTSCYTRFQAVRGSAALLGLTLGLRLGVEVPLPPIIHESAFCHRRRRTGLASRERGPEDGACASPAVPGGRAAGGRGVCIGIGRVGGDVDAADGAAAVPTTVAAGGGDCTAATAAYASVSRLKAASLFLAWLRSGWSCSESLLYARLASASEAVRVMSSTP